MLIFSLYFKNKLSVEDIQDNSRVQNILQNRMLQLNQQIQEKELVNRMKIMETKKAALSMILKKEESKNISKCSLNSQLVILLVFWVFNAANSP